MKRQLITAALATVLAVGMEAQTQGLQGHYWFDSSQQRQSFEPGHIELDVSSLSEGLHTLNAKVTDEKGTPSTIATAWFMRMPLFAEGITYNVNTFIDGVPAAQYQTPVAGGNLAIMCDMSAVSIGAHTLGVQVITDKGVVSAFKEAMFMRIPTTEENRTLRAYYMIDGNAAGEPLVPVMNGNTYHLDLDVSSLTSGIHSVTSYLASPLGLASDIRTSWFVKIPNGGEGVVAYEYWLNDNIETMQTVTLDKVTNPCSLVGLLDMPIEPFCSSRYRFALEDGAPVVYGCNSFQVRFRDPDGRFSMAAGEFADTRVRQELKDVPTITANERTSTGKIEENTIRWYKFKGEIGDSIGIRLDDPAMVEIYDPEGELLLSRTKDNAREYAAKMLRLNGIYHIAIHDNTYNQPVHTDFTHIPKFALIHATPNHTAVDCRFCMNVVGNGFDSLQSLKLLKDNNYYEPNKIDVIDNYQLEATFELPSNTELGSYKLKAIFREEKGNNEVILDDAVKFEEYAEGEIKVEVDNPFIPQTPYEFNIRVTNTSNRGCWGIPVNIAFPKTDQECKVYFKNFIPTTDNDIPIKWHADNLLASGEEGVMIPMIIPYLSAGETITLTLGAICDSHEILKVYAWAATAWSDEFHEILSDDFDMNQILDLQPSNIISAKAICLAMAKDILKKNGGGTKRAPDLGTARDLAESNANVAQAIGLTIGGISNGLRLRGIDAYGIDLSTGEYDSLRKYRNNLKRNMPSPLRIFFTAFGETYPDELDNCNNPNPRPNPHRINCYQSGDPNDMKGYVAPSGSQHIGIDVKTLNYTIEFENDPEFANAPASRIEVNQTVDGKMFDLSTFKPLSMKLGNKEVELPAEHHFVKTVDMRPEIYAIAELTFDFDTTTGSAAWKLRSLDPLTMEDTKYMTDGILPVNDDSGKGCGYFTYAVDLKPRLADETEISAKASIVFDANEPIETPVWTNITDYTRPEARIVSKESADGITFDFVAEGSDSGSGIWLYDLYMRPGGEEKWKVVKTAIDSDTFSYTAQEAVPDAEFAVLATDRAGNRQSDAMMNGLLGDADDNGVVDANDAVVIRNYFTGSSTTINRVNADVNGDNTIDSQDATYIRSIFLGDNARNYKRVRKYLK